MNLGWVKGGNLWAAQKLISILTDHDVYIQAILPLRGKILNIEKCSTEKIYQNVELQALISALGLGVSAQPFLLALYYIIFRRSFPQTQQILTPDV